MDGPALVLAVVGPLQHNYRSKGAYIAPITCPVRPTIKFCVNPPFVLYYKVPLLITDFVRQFEPMQTLLFTSNV